MSAIIVNVLPSPMGSAMIPPRNWGGSSAWYPPDMLLMKLGKWNRCKTQAPIVSLMSMEGSGTHT